MARIPFNLKKAQLPSNPDFSSMENKGLYDSPDDLGVEPLEIMDTDMADMDQDLEDNQDDLQFADAAQLRDFLDKTDEQNANLILREKLDPTDIVQIPGHDKPTERLQVLSDTLSQYYSAIDSDTKLKLAQHIFDYALSGAEKLSEPDDKNTFQLPESNAMQDINDTIKKLSSNIIDAKKAISHHKSFNFKTAQHKTLNNTIVWGPGQVKIDPFLRQPVSDWHIVERNKGFGLVVDDVWNIDWERIWRSTIMDKYSRPYRDKNGNWVGGYMEKRFETDKNIPDTNNYQLKPGELRKPRLPEYGNTEARLQAMRHKNDKEFDYNNTEKPTDWHDTSWNNTVAVPYNKKTASIKKKTLIAESNINTYPGRPPEKGPFDTKSPFDDKQVKVTPKRSCPFCHSLLQSADGSPTPSQCPSCHMNLIGQNTEQQGLFERRPLMQGESPVAPQQPYFVKPNAPIVSSQVFNSRNNKFITARKHKIQLAKEKLKPISKVDPNFIGDETKSAIKPTDTTIQQKKKLPQSRYKDYCPIHGCRTGPDICNAADALCIDG